MGHAVTAFSNTVARIAEYPLFVLLFGGVATVLTFLNFIVGQIPLLGWILSPFVVGPIVTTGLLAIAFDFNKHGDVQLSEFMDGAGEYWPTLAVAYLLGSVVGVVALVIATMGLTIFAGVGSAVLSSSPEAAASGMGLVTVLGVLAIFALILLAAGIFQFIDVAIVLNGATATRSFGVSWELFKSAPVSVIGYSVARALMTFGFSLLTASILGGLGGAVTSPGSDVGFLLFVLGWFFGSIVSSSFSTLYHVKYFLRMSEDHDLTSGDDARRSRTIGNDEPLTADATAKQPAD